VAKRVPTKRVTTKRGAAKKESATRAARTLKRGAAVRGGKRPLDIDLVMRRLRDAVANVPKAAMFELADDGHDTPFEQLVACLISIRTRDEVMIETARALFAVARTPAEMMRLSVGEIDALIRASTFHRGKAAQIREIAGRLLREHGGALPCDESLMLSFRGVGPKCTNLVLGIACGEARIGVDVHVWRVTNRWGYILASTPEKAMVALMDVLPKKYWVEINRLLVPFGKHICTGVLPKCSTCPVLEMCRQVGVDRHR
jgi:endonuclease-3